MITNWNDPTQRVCNGHDGCTLCAPGKIVNEADAESLRIVGGGENKEWIDQIAVRCFAEYPSVIFQTAHFEEFYDGIRAALSEAWEAGQQQGRQDTFAEIKLDGPCDCKICAESFAAYKKELAGKIQTLLENNTASLHHDKECIPEDFHSLIRAGGYYAALIDVFGILQTPPEDPPPSPAHAPNSPLE